MFLTIMKLALRNIFRNSRRTIITLCSITMGGTAIILVGGYIDYNFWGLREVTIHSELGHMQFYKKGFNQLSKLDPNKYLMSKEQGEKLEAIVRSSKEVILTANRLSTSGIIGNGEKTVFFMGQGVEPDKEAKISNSLNVVKGRNLFDDDAYKVVLGRKLAEQLDLKPGDTTTLVVTTLSGSINAIDFTVVGLISNGYKEFEDKIVRMRLEDMQELLGTTNFERKVVLLKETLKTKAVASVLKKKIENQSFEMLLWTDLADYYQQVKTIYINIFNFLKSIILVIIVLSIINTMTMSVMERITEFGTLRAMGTTRQEILLMMISEGFLLGILGGITSLISGVSLAFIINILGGIPLEAPPGHTQGYQIFINLVPDVLIFSFAVAIIAAIISSIAPAIKASKLDVVEALRHV